MAYCFSFVSSQKYLLITLWFLFLTQVYLDMYCLLSKYLGILSDFSGKIHFDYSFLATPLALENILFMTSIFLHLLRLFHGPEYTYLSNVSRMYSWKNTYTVVGWNVIYISIMSSWLSIVQLLRFLVYLFYWMNKEY